LAAGIYRFVSADAQLLDDAFFYARYATHVLEGHGHAWNVGEPPVYGSTSVLYVLVLVLLSSLTGAEPVTLLPILSGSFGLLFLVALVLYCARTTGRPVSPDRYLVIASGITLVFLGPPAFTSLSASGMETTLAMLCNLALVAATLRLIEAPTNRAIALALATGYLALLARPEGAIYAVGLLCLALLLFHRSRGGQKQAFAFAAAFAAVLAVDAGLKTVLLGSALPASFFVKSGGFLEHYLGYASWNPFRLSAAFTATLVIPSGALVLACGRRSDWRLIAVFAVPVLGVAVYLLSAVQIMGMHARFYHPMAPLIVVPTVLIVDRALRGPKGARRLRGRLLPVIAWVLCVAVIYGVGDRLFRAVHEPEDAPDPGRRYVTRTQEPLPTAGSHALVFALVRALPDDPSVVIAAGEHGRLSAEVTGMTLVDLTGLHDLGLARRGFEAGRILDRAPALIWMPHPHYPAQIDALLSPAAFWAGYDFYPQLGAHGLAIRREGPHAAALNDRLAGIWERHYRGRSLDAYR
jgi:hypothetical protein